MTEISNLQGSSFLDSLALKPEVKEKALGKSEFLELLVTQLNNQNPLEPQANGDFIAQLAQFSSVEGIDNLNSSFGDLAASLKSSQALQASSLVGRSVLVPGASTVFNQEKLSGVVQLETSTPQLVVAIKGENGEVLESTAVSGR